MMDELMRTRLRNENHLVIVNRFFIKYLKSFLCGILIGLLTSSIGLFSEYQIYSTYCFLILLIFNLKWHNYILSFLTGIVAFYLFPSNFDITNIVIMVCVMTYVTIILLNDVPFDQKYDVVTYILTSLIMTFGLLICKNMVNTFNPSLYVFVGIPCALLNTLIIRSQYIMLNQNNYFKPLARIMYVYWAFMFYMNTKYV